MLRLVSMQGYILAPACLKKLQLNVFLNWNSGVLKDFLITQFNQVQHQIIQMDINHSIPAVPNWCILDFARDLKFLECRG